MGVALQHSIIRLAGARVEGALSRCIANRPARRNANRTQQHHFGGSIIIAKPLAQVEQEPIHGFLVARHICLDHVHIGDVLTQVVGDSAHLFKRRLQAEGDLLGKLAGALRDRIGELQVALFDPVRVVSSRRLEFGDGGMAHRSLDRINVPWIERGRGAEGGQVEVAIWIFVIFNLGVFADPHRLGRGVHSGNRRDGNELEGSLPASFLLRKWKIISLGREITRLQVVIKPLPVDISFVGAGAPVQADVGWQTQGRSHGEDLRIAQGRAAPQVDAAAIHFACQCNG